MRRTNDDEGAPRFLSLVSHGRKGGGVRLPARRPPSRPHSCPIYRISIVIIRSALPMSFGVKATEKEIGETWSAAKRTSILPSFPPSTLSDTRRLSGPATAAVLFFLLLPLPL